MNKFKILLGVSALALAGHGMYLYEEGASAYTAVIASGSGASRSEWVLPDGQGLQLNSRERQSLKIHLAATGAGYAALYFGEGGKPQLSIFLSGPRTLIVPPGEYPPAEWFDVPASAQEADWRAQIWTSPSLIRIVTQDGQETRLPMSDLGNVSWYNGLARVFVSNTTLTVYRLSAPVAGSLLLVR